GSAGLLSSGSGISGSTGILSSGSEISGSTGILSSGSGSLSVGLSGSAGLSPSRFSGQSFVATRPQTQRTSQGSTKPSCPPGQIFDSCARTCPKVCNVEADPISCNKGCILACFCPDGYLFESLNSRRCVQPSQCPGERTRTLGVSLGGGGNGGGLVGSLLGGLLG
ncbi:adhesion G-protein coupled receptor V1, partial [Nephila pilipes]